MMRPGRSPFGGRLALLAGLMGCFLLSQGGCAWGPGGQPAKADALEVVDADSASGAPSLVTSPRVRRLSKRGWVEVEAAIRASDDESPANARRRALQRARQAAVEFVAGVRVRSSVVTLDHVGEGGASDLLQALTATQANALIVDEKLMGSRMLMSSDGSGYVVRVKMAARVLEHGAGGADFETEVRLNDSSYRAGDRVELSIRVSEPARIYVLGVSDEGAVVLLPNRHMPDTRIAAETWLEFPGDELEGRGVAMHASLPEGRVRSQEALIVVALRGRRRLDDLFPASGDTFRSAEGSRAMTLASDFLSPLLSIPTSDWTFDQIVYSIRD